MNQLNDQRVLSMTASPTSPDALFGAYDAGLVAHAVQVVKKTVAGLGGYEKQYQKMQHVEVSSSPLDRQDASRLRTAALWAMNKTIHDPRLRLKIADRIVAFTGDPQAPPLVRAPVSPGTDGELHTSGLMFLENLLSQSELRETQRFFETLTAETVEESIFYFGIADVVRAPHLMRAAVSPAVLEAVSSYLGGPATVMNLSAWTSQPGSEAQGAQIFHRDRDDFRACKLFIYLSDVDPATGPHTFIRHSHRLDGVYQRIPENTPKRDAVVGQLFMENGRHAQHLVSAFLGRDAVEITGPAGTAFLETTYGYHRGKVPEAGPRLLFQALYTLIPYPHNVDRLAQSGLVKLPADVPDTPAIRHALRFILPDA
jgi:hypothetical protein